MARVASSARCGQASVCILTQRSQLGQACIAEGKHAEAMRNQCGNNDEAIWPALAKPSVVRVLQGRGHGMQFRLSSPPLHIAPRFCCSFTSLSQFPGHELPGCRNLRCRTLAEYKLSIYGPPGPLWAGPLWAPPGLLWAAPSWAGP